MFDSQDPFPLAPDWDYQKEKDHAALVDAWLGFDDARICAIESELKNIDPDRELWAGKSIQTFSTPYTELRMMLEDLKLTTETIADLGAGYGRLAHVLDRHFPRAKFVGFEIVEARQTEGARVIAERGLKHARLEHGDVNDVDFSTLDADILFMYDFGSRRDVEICVERLRLFAVTTQTAQMKPLTIVARGGRSREIIEKKHAWLSQIVTPVHRTHYSIYRSAE